MPASANLLDNFLGKANDPNPIVSESYVKAIGNYVMENWDTYDTGNTIQSVLIPLAARSATDAPTSPLGLPQSIANMIKDVHEGKTHYDVGTNEFIITVISMYAQNLLNGCH